LLFIGAPAASAGRATTVAFQEDFGSFNDFLWGAAFQSGGSPSAGTADAWEGVLTMDPAVSGARSALAAKMPVNTSLPATVRFKVRFPGATYRVANFRLLGSYDAEASFTDAIVTWRLGTTDHAAGGPPSVRIAARGGAREIVADSWPVLPSDTWLEGEIQLFEDRVVTKLGESTIEALGDVQAAVSDWPGLYPAFETLDDTGANGFEIDYVVIEQGVAEPENQPPVAVAGDDRSALIGRPVVFDGSASSDPDGSIVSYEWDFGDGATASTVVATHAYAAAGTYTARLTVTDDKGATGVDEASVRVITPETSMQELKGDIVASLTRPPYNRGVRQRLLVTLNSAIRAYRAGNYLRSIQMMRVFSAKVRVLRGKKYTHDRADRWVAWSAGIQASLRTIQAARRRK
jgi:hypothetical protein